MAKRNQRRAVIRRCEDTGHDPFRSRNILFNHVAFCVRQMRPDDVTAVAALERELYGTEHDDRVKEEGLRSWFGVHPYSAYLIEHTPTRRLLGGVGLWPITEDAYLKLVGGGLNEAELNVDHLAPGVGPGSVPHHFWYLGALEAAAMFMTQSSRGAIAERLLRVVLADWLKESFVANRFRIAAIGYSEPGRHMLATFGFHFQCPGSEGHHVYCKSIEKDELRVSFTERFFAEVLGEEREKHPLAWGLIRAVRDCGVAGLLRVQKARSIYKG